MGYPYYDGITGLMKGKKDDVEAVGKRLVLLFKTQKREEVSYKLNNSEIQFLKLCSSFGISENGDYMLSVDRNGNLILEDAGDGFNVEMPWKSLYPAISKVFPNVKFFFSTSIGGEFGEGAAWHIYENGNCQDSGHRNYESGGLVVAKRLLHQFYEPEIEARARLWELENCKDKSAIDKAMNDYEKTLRAADRMEEIARLGNSVWEQAINEALVFTDFDVDNDLLAELLETVKKGTLGVDGDFPPSLEAITAINLNGCEQIDALPEVIMRCTNLTRISLIGTGVKEIPKWLLKMQEAGVKVIQNSDDDDDNNDEITTIAPLQTRKQVAGEAVKENRVLIDIEGNVYNEDEDENDAEITTVEEALAAVQESGNMLEYLPEALKTAEVCLAAVQENGSMIDYVPEVLKTVEVCLAAVQEHGTALMWIPEALKTEAVCLAAVKNNEDAMDYVPKKLQATIKSKLK